MPEPNVQMSSTDRVWRCAHGSDCTGVAIGMPEMWVPRCAHGEMEQTTAQNCRPTRPTALTYLMRELRIDGKDDSAHA